MSQLQDGNNTPVQEVVENTALTPKNEFTEGRFDPADVTAAFFKKQKPVLKRLLSQMSAKQMRRFVMNVAAFPLVDKGDLPQTQQEKDAAYIFSEMSLNKSLMIMTEEFKRTEAAMNKQKEQPATEGTESNG